MEKEKLDSIDLALIDYMDRDCVDYAYLLNGDWGCGKTYYCNKILKDLLNDYCKHKEKKKYVVSISLFGRKQLGNAFTEITIKAIGIEKGYGVLDRLCVAEASSVAADISNKSWVSSVVSYLGKTLNKNLPSIVQGIENIDMKDQVLIVFDDLERCEAEDLKQIIGKIQTDFIDNGYHVLFVANEEEIKWKEFSKWKEKFIRTTLSFTKPLASIICQIIDYRKDSPIKVLYGKDKSKFLHLINQFSKINNVRTWMYAFDLYDKTVLEATIVDSNPYLWNLLAIVLLSIYYFNKDKQLLTDVKIIVDKDDKTPTIRKAVSADFGIDCETVLGFFGRDWIISSRLKSLSYVYVVMKSIIDLIQNGSLDVDLFSDEFETAFPCGNKYEIEYSKSADFFSLDDEELKDNVSVLIDGIDNGKFKIYQLINLASTFQILDENGYLTFAKCNNYQKKIVEAVERLNIERLKTNISDLKRRYTGAPEFIKPSITHVIEKLESFDSQKDDFFKFFYQVKNEGIFDMKSPISDIFFGYIEKYGLAGEFVVFSGKALSAVDEYVFSITRYDGCGRIHSDKIMPMRYLVDEIDKYLSLDDERNKHYYDLKYFNGLLKAAIKKLEINI